MNLRNVTLHKAKWLKLENLIFETEKGETRTWEMCSRNTRKGACDAVVIIPTLESSVLIVKQFRPPTSGFCWEFPAGLIDENETFEQAALRELKEETGYSGKVLSVGKPMFNDPGLTDANSVIVRIELLEKGETDFQEGENIESRLIKKVHLKKFLENCGCAVDVRLGMYAEIQ